MKKLFLMLISLLPLTALAELNKTETLHFPSNPALFPDAQVIYFSYGRDIFKVNINDGTAFRFVSLGGDENYPIVSPNGKLLAFSSTINGNNDVYLVSTNGGKVK